jgi:hypothetical protein
MLSPPTWSNAPRPTDETQRTEVVYPSDQRQKRPKMDWLHSTGRHASVTVRRAPGGAQLSTPAGRDDIGTLCQQRPRSRRVDRGHTPPARLGRPPAPGVPASTDIPAINPAAGKSFTAEPSESPIGAPGSPVSTLPEDTDSSDAKSARLRKFVHPNPNESPVHASRGPDFGTTRHGQFQRRSDQPPKLATQPERKSHSCTPGPPIFGLLEGADSSNTEGARHRNSSTQPDESLIAHPGPPISTQRRARQGRRQKGRRQKSSTRSGRSPIRASQGLPVSSLAGSTDRTVMAAGSNGTFARRAPERERGRAPAPRNPVQLAAPTNAERWWHEWDIRAKTVLRARWREGPTDALPPPGAGLAPRRQSNLAGGLDRRGAGPFGGAGSEMSDVACVDGLSVGRLRQWSFRVWCTRKGTWAAVGPPESSLVGCTDRIGGPGARVGLSCLSGGVGF